MPINHVYVPIDCEDSHVLNDEERGEDDPQLVIDFEELDRVSLLAPDAEACEEDGYTPPRWHWATLEPEADHLVLTVAIGDGRAIVATIGPDGAAHEIVQLELAPASG